jgi:hypothetical protein
MKVNGKMFISKLYLIMAYIMYWHLILYVVHSSELSKSYITFWYDPSLLIVS